MRPHRRQPIRPHRPWDSPGKNIGVGCHFLSNAWKWKVNVKSLSRVRLFATPWTAAHQAPPSMGFSRQECWSGCRRLLCLLFKWWHLKHLTLVNLKLLTILKGNIRYLNILIFVLFSTWGRKRLNLLLPVKLHHYNLEQAVSKAPVSGVPRAAYAMILIIHRFCTANSPTC